MIDLNTLELWLVTGSQHLYGSETLLQIDEHARQVSQGLDEASCIPVRVVFKPVVATSSQIVEVMQQANVAPQCIGVICWMHTFSPGKMWIAGLRQLNKPLCHLHTQFNRLIPWSTIDMDFMNLNQSAHGGREFGHVVSRLGINRKVIVGHWQDERVARELGIWSRAAAAWHDAHSLRIARFGDNMRQVTVTEGDKIDAQIRFGYEVHGYGLGELTEFLSNITDAQLDRLCAEYEDLFDMAPDLRPGGKHHSDLRDAARIELALRAFLEDGGFGAFTDTFEDLHGLVQLPGIAVQRLLADGYGFGAEGDWKHAALVRAMKVMAIGLDGGTTFMEDYTYHMDGEEGHVLGAHMLEVCPSIAADRPSCAIHPLSIGGKAGPVRLVFEANTGPAVNASVVDMGDRFRMVVNAVDVITCPSPLPQLPVAHALWTPRPDLPTAATAWIYAGGAHHTGFSLALGTQHLEDFAEIADVEFLLIDQDTDLRRFKNDLRRRRL